jgi:two-component system, NarL family, nitrate/nitrite response regulator NarL
MDIRNIQIIDSSRLFREGLKRLFESGPFKVTAEASSLDDAVHCVLNGDTRTDLLLLQWTDGDPDLADTIRAFLAANPDMKIVALADTIDAGSLAQALRIGVRGYLLKDMSPEALLHSLLLVQTGEVVFPTELARLLTASPTTPAGRTGISPGTMTHDLSEREIQILYGLARGHSNKMIARSLDLAEGTVKVHLKSLLRKINARNRTQAAIWAINNGMVDKEPALADGHDA